MEDYKLFFYFILLIFYFIYQFIKGKKPEKGSSAPDSSRPKRQVPPHWEREIERPQDKPIYERNIVTEHQEKPYYEKEVPQRKPLLATHDYMKEARNDSKKLKKHSDELKRNMETKREMDAKKVSHYRSIDTASSGIPSSTSVSETKNNSFKPLLEMLKKPEGARDAFILSEIINKKYE